MKDVAALIEASSFLAVRDQLICLDDLERKGDGLKIKELFGLVSYLKEQRRRKVVLILNDGAFDTKEKEDFHQYFEKTVDSHVRFAPSAEECTRIALPESSDFHDKMRAHCTSLGISNIRVIRRIERMARMLQPMLANLHERVFEDYLRDLVLLGWCKFAADGPPLEFVKTRHNQLYLPAKQKSEDETKWGPLLDRYGFRHFSSASSLLLAAIEQGFFDAAALEPEARKLHEGYVAQQSEADFHEAWQIYHRGFGDDEKELVEALSTSFRKNVQYIHPMNANGTIVLLKDLGHTALASELIALYVARRSAETFDRSNMFRENDITDPEFQEAVKKKIVDAPDARDPKDVLLKIARQQGWGKQDTKLLSKVDARGYYDIFKSIGDDDELTACIRMALSFGEGAGDPEKAIARSAKDALIEIAAESKLNSRRVQSKYGIEIE